MGNPLYPLIDHLEKLNPFPSLTTIQHHRVNGTCLSAQVFGECENGMTWTLQGILSDQESVVVFSHIVTVLSVGLALLFVICSLRLRSNKKKFRDHLRSDERRILRRLEDLTLKLEVRDMDCNVLKQQLLSQEQASNRRLEQAAQRLVGEQGKRIRVEELLADAEAKQQSTEARLESIMARLKDYEERHQDNECQLLEEKLKTERTTRRLAERDAQLEHLVNINAGKAKQIQDLREKCKIDSLKAEAIIHRLTTESGERFSLLQEEGDLIRTGLMGALEETKKRYIDNKALMKQELQIRDQKITCLQEELRGGNN